MKPSKTQTFSFLISGITVFLLGLSPVHAGQDPCGQPGHDVIVIHTEQSFEEAYRTIGRLLVTHDFLVAHSDPLMGVVTTASKQVGFPSMVWSVKVSALVTGTDQATILLTAMTQDHPGNPWNPALNHEGRTNRLSRYGWEEICAIAGSFPEAAITTSKRP